MDDITKNQNNPVGAGLGGQSGGWQDTNRDVVNPSDRQGNDNLDGSDLFPVPVNELDALDDDEENSDLAGPMAEDDTSYSEFGDDDEILPPGPGNPEIGDERDNRIIQDPLMDADPLMDEDPAEDPSEDPDMPLR